MEKQLGRPEIPFDQDTAKQICDMIESGMTLNAICQLPDIPSIPTVYKWLDNHPDFFQNYARARSKQADTFADMVMTEAFNSHDAQIGRLRIDALKWTASKLAPKKYGDRVEVEQTGNANFKLTFAVPDRNTKDSLTELPAPIVTPQILDIEAEPVNET